MKINNFVWPKIFGHFFLASLKKSCIFMHERKFIFNLKFLELWKIQW